MPSRLALILLFVCAALLLAPTVTRLWLPPGKVENKALAKLPVIKDALFLRPGALGEGLAPYIKDRLGLRRAALGLHTIISQTLFDESGVSVALQGRDGFYFYRSELTRGCQYKQSAEELVSNLQDWADYYHSKGGRLVLALIPDKAMLYGDKLTDLEQDLYACAREKNTAVRALLPAVRNITYLDFLPGLQAEEAVSPTPIYFKTDTHWTWDHAPGLAQRIVDALQPGLWQPGAFIEGRHEDEAADLTAMIGRPQGHETIYDLPHRDGITTVITTPSDTVKRHSVSTGTAPLFQPPIVYRSDSFFEKSNLLFEAYFADISQVTPNNFADPTLIEAMQHRKVFVVETVMRNFYEVFGEYLTHDNLVRVMDATPAYSAAPPAH